MKVRDQKRESKGPLVMTQVAKKLSRSGHGSIYEYSTSMSSYTVPCFRNTWRVGKFQITGPHIQRCPVPGNVDVAIAWRAFKQPRMHPRPFKPKSRGGAQLVVYILHIIYKIYLYAYICIQSSQGEYHVQSSLTTAQRIINLICLTMKYIGSRY